MITSVSNSMITVDKVLLLICADV